MKTALQIIFILAVCVIALALVINFVPVETAESVGYNYGRLMWYALPVIAILGVGYIGYRAFIKKP